MIEITIGDDTPFALNPWTNVIETEKGEHPVVQVKEKAEGYREPFKWESEEEARRFAEALEDQIAAHDEAVFLVTDRTFPEGDGDPIFRYYVTDVIPGDTFARFLDPHREITVPANEVREGDTVVRFAALSSFGSDHQVNREVTSVSEPWMDRGLSYVTIHLADNEIARNSLLNLAPNRPVVIRRSLEGVTQAS